MKKKEIKRLAKQRLEEIRILKNIISERGKQINFIRQENESLKSVIRDDDTFRVKINFETTLKRRKQEIMQLKGEVQGLRELNGILEAMILQLVEEKGKAVISRAKLREGIGQSFSIKATDEEFILSAECGMRSEE